MYTSYSSLGCRSRSTTDIFTARSLDNASPHQPVIGANDRRRRRQAVPAPPRRADSFAGVVPSALKRAKANEACRRLVETTSAAEIETPRTSFVKKLVASLERRQKEISACKAADDEFIIAKRFERDEASVSLIHEEIQQQTYTCLPVTRHLEDVQEREHEDEEDYDDFSDLDDEPSSTKFWSTNDLVAPPILSVNNDNNNDTVDPEPKPTGGFQRSIKNMFSSLLSWRSSSKSLAKGSREYYSRRESLGDELGDFRKHTMPRLIERATSKSRLDRSRGETSRRNLREFSDFIGESKSHEASKASIATIHPVYGTLKRIPRVQEIEPRDVVYGSIKVQLPEVPTRQSSSLPSEHHPLLSRKHREMHKRLTSLEPGKVKRASSIVYDVPTVISHRRKVSSSTPKYENFKQILDSDSKPARSSMLTKF